MSAHKVDHNALLHTAGHYDLNWLAVGKLGENTLKIIKQLSPHRYFLLLEGKLLHKQTNTKG